jgi:DnaJ-domain-containing protein 1
MTELARGTVADRPWGRTLGALGLRGLSGQLTLLGDGKPYRIAFEQGAVVGASSPLASDAAVRVALTGGLITSTQVADIMRRIATSPHRDELEVLAEVVRLPVDHAMKLRRRLVAQRAARTFSVEQGDFVVEDRIDVPVVPGTALDVRAVIYLGARANLTEERLGNEVARLGGWFRIKSDIIADLAQFGFTEPDKPILQRLITGVNIDDLEASAADGIGEHGVRAIVYALVACNACEIEGEPRPSVARTTRETFERGMIRATTPPINQRAARSSTNPPQASRTTSVDVPDGMQLRSPRSTTPPTRHGGTTTGPFPTVSRTQTPTTAPTTPRTQTPTTAPTPPRTPTNPTPTGPMQPRTATPGSTPPPAARTRTGPTPSRTQTPLPPAAARTPTPTGPQMGRVPTNPAVARATTPTTIPATSRVPTNPAVGRAPTPGGTAVGRTPTPLDLLGGDPVRRPPLSRIKRSTAAAQETETLIRERLALLDRGVDHFSLLGITHDASADVTRAAYFTLARKLHPDRLASLGIADAAHSAQRLMAQINTAFATLTDPLRRSEYTQTLSRGGEAVVREEEAKANAEAMRAMHAEEAFRRGEMALRREQLDQALVEFTTALELRNNEPEYQAMLAWTRFAASGDKQAIAQETRQKLLRAADHSEHSPAARFYLGRVERILGREREALSHFQEVLRIKPNHAEASSEIRVLEARLKKR